MGFDDAEVLFDRPDLTYNVGDIVHGKLIFQQDKVKTFRGIFLRAKGFCNVHWTTHHTRTTGTGENRRTESYTVQHNSHEVYFEQKIYLIGREQGEYHLNPGRHEFPFQCLIPAHCPSSYEGGNGHIRYEFKFVVDRIMKFDQEKTVQINVVALRDLNKDPYCKQPMEFEFLESYCCWCVSSGTCEVIVKLPASGYCPGQVIKADVTCANKSNVEIEAIKLELKEETTFRATSAPDTRHEKSTIAKIKKGPIPKDTSRNWIVEIEVPYMDVRNVDACSYIDVDYEFEVHISTSGCHEDGGASRRIVLGNIPLREFDEAPHPGGNMITQPTAPSQFYKAGNDAFVGPNQPYPNQPYPDPNQPYPGPNPPYPGANPPYPGPNPPYPGANPPYPGPNPPYPGGNPVTVYPAPNPPPMGFGFGVPVDGKDATMPLLPPGAGVPYPPNSGSPFATATAPEPSTPDFDGKKPPMGSENNPAFNPNFAK